MSDFARTHGASTTTTGGEHPDHRPDAAAHEAYSFACMRCGYGWEQAYEIVHEVDGKGSCMSSTTRTANASGPR